MIWATEDADPAGGTFTMFKVVAGLGVGALAAAAFFWLVLKQSEKHVEEKRVMREERREDIARLERRVDQLFRYLRIPPGEDGP